MAIQDFAGSIIAALSQKIGLPHTVELAKASTAHRVVAFARELNIYKVVVEGDCLQVV